LRILSGVELGEPHWFPKETAEVLGAGKLDRVLGSIHCVHLNGEEVDASQFKLRPPAEQALAVTEYFRETLAMVESSQPFEVLAHLDYPKRYCLMHLRLIARKTTRKSCERWLTAAARRGCVLEVNTTRGQSDERKLCPGLTVVHWWPRWEGRLSRSAVTRTSRIRFGGGFQLATRVVEAAGFKPAPDPMASGAVDPPSDVARAWGREHRA